MPFEKGKTPEGAKPFVPGESGNPDGRPLGAKNRSTIARKVLEMKALFNADTFEKLQEQFPEITKESTAEEIMTIIQVSNAVSGCDKAYKAVMDSAYGAPTQEIGHTITEQPLFGKSSE